MCSALRFCLSVYLSLLPLGMAAAPRGTVLWRPGAPHGLPRRTGGAGTATPPRLSEEQDHSLCMRRTMDQPGTQPCESVEAFRARILAKLTYATGKDLTSACPHDWFEATALAADRKSTRLNSSHVKISYAV